MTLLRAYLCCVAIASLPSIQSSSSSVSSSLVSAQQSDQRYNSIASHSQPRVRFTRYATHLSPQYHQHSHELTSQQNNNDVKHDESIADFAVADSLNVDVLDAQSPVNQVDDDDNVDSLSEDEFESLPEIDSIESNDDESTYNSFDNETNNFDDEQADFDNYDDDDSTDDASASAVSNSVDNIFTDSFKQNYQKTAGSNPLISIGNRPSVIQKRSTFASRRSSSRSQPQKAAAYMGASDRYNRPQRRDAANDDDLGAGVDVNAGPVSAGVGGGVGIGNNDNDYSPSPQPVTPVVPVVAANTNGKQLIAANHVTLRTKTRKRSLVAAALVGAAIVGTAAIIL